jgi:hypothetical protein
MIANPAARIGWSPRPQVRAPAQVITPTNVAISVPFDLVATIARPTSPAEPTRNRVETRPSRPSITNTVAMR